MSGNRRRRKGQAGGDGGQGQAPAIRYRRRENSDARSLLTLLFPLLVMLVGVWWLYFRRSSNAEDDDGTRGMEVAFEVMDLPGRGKGAIATRDIAQGELILREKALFIVPVEIKQDPIQFLKSHLSNLTSSQSSAYWALSHHAGSNKNTLHDFDAFLDSQMLSIFQTNAINAGPGRVGLFPKTARLNHGCVKAFNCVYSWREEEGILVTHALKPIKKGEELLNVYFNTRQSRSARQAYLKDNYHFECGCETCSLPRAEQIGSDRRIAKMNELYKTFGTWDKGKISGKKAAETVREIWKLGEEEGYWSGRGQLASDMAYVAAAHSDMEATREWARVSDRWFGYELGADSKYVREMREVVKRPSGHQMWGRREEQIVGGPDEEVKR